MTRHLTTRTLNTLKRNGLTLADAKAMRRSDLRKLECLGERGIAWIKRTKITA